MVNLSSEQVALVVIGAVFVTFDFFLLMAIIPYCLVKMRHYLNAKRLGQMRQPMEE